MKRPLRLKDRLPKSQLAKRKEHIAHRALPVQKRLRAERAPAQISNIGALDLFAKRS